MNTVSVSLDEIELIIRGILPRYGACSRTAALVTRQHLTKTYKIGFGTVVLGIR